jgi:TPR repeat protein
LAVEWWLKAAAVGHQVAQYNLGLAYQAGAGVEKDDVQSFQWVRKAADQGLPEAQYYTKA